MKLCRTCGETKDLGDFTRDRNRSDGVASRCKTCKREYFRQYRADNAERLRSYDRQWAEANRDSRREATRRWREAHPDYDLTRNRARYA